MTIKVHPDGKKLTLVGFALSVALAGTAAGQNYPTKPIHVYTSDIGGGTDIVARIIGQVMAGTLGQQVVI